MGSDVHDSTQHIQPLHGVQDFTAAGGKLLLCGSFILNSKKQYNNQQEPWCQKGAHGKYFHQNSSLVT
jgi:hypothetical protein